jgi:hypothetical protein
VTLRRRDREGARRADSDPSRCRGNGRPRHQRHPSGRQRILFDFATLKRKSGWILYDRFATCWQPYVKGPTMMVDSIFNSNRGEDWWLDK